jgi:hypothetical protein
MRLRCANSISTFLRNRREVRLRQRARNGKAIVSVEIDLLPVTELLIDKGLLPITGAEDRGAIGDALEKLLAQLIAAPARDA